MSHPAAASLRSDAQALAATLPPLLAEARHLAATVLMGEHGRRRAGQGDEFWQYRPAMPGDPLRRIDWRRSGRSDAHYVREKEWQAAQSVVLWVDNAQSMQFSGDNARPNKSARARLLAMAAAVLLMDGGERVGLAGLALPPRRGSLQLLRLAETLSEDQTSDDYGAAESRALRPNSRALYLSDFLGDIAPLELALAKAADRGVVGALVQVLDPVEEAFPYDGRTIFESMGGGLQHETLKAGDLRGRYLERLAERRDQIATLARAAGWQFETHHTGDPALQALLWIYRALEKVH
ncbi:hypothetical protein ACMU_16205 [Actibacterium mucosum KCTC 23349]|uniref:DUF58 domain-containing protein n=1 Tax=Actibacterium mucosum KCTC 23349 TaxID=1454373 RepID=A0A037ZEU0_9RHOB|nr:DUF58 domain-containing protein [Actibacterium mucosum]KAJ54657.1 hypothetical protein ACMU_16205 [Actibacterium mucosum KCTC 23349]